MFIYKAIKNALIIIGITEIQHDSISNVICVLFNKVGTYLFETAFLWIILCFDGEAALHMSVTIDLDGFTTQQAYHTLST